MKLRIYRFVIWILILHLFFDTLPLIALNATETTNSALGSAFDNTINTDYKSFTIRKLIEQITEDTEAGRPINWEKLKQELSSKPYLTNLAISGGSEVAGLLIQLGMAGVAPPYGVIVGSAVSAVMNYGGGAIGYEAYSVAKTGKELTTREILGKALVNLDMPMLVGRTIGSTIGATVGQAIIPIPVVGMLIGGVVGSIAGNLVVKGLRIIPTIDKWCESFQKQWQKVGESILKSKPETKPGALTSTSNPATSTQTVIPSDRKITDKKITDVSNPFVEDKEIKIKYMVP
ncbi:MAG: hypothetical protein HQM10_22600 [Candidatus Riflebacteria bacterium]|nr:hypothetical protein [Candidatus Riflebacteria bacterium]